MTIEAIRPSNFFIGPIQPVEGFVTLVGASGYESSNTPEQTLKLLERDEARLNAALRRESLRMLKDSSRTDQRFVVLRERWHTSRLELFFAQGGSDLAKRHEGFQPTRGEELGGQNG